MRESQGTWNHSERMEASLLTAVGSDASGAQGGATVAATVAGMRQEGGASSGWGSEMSSNL